MHEQEFMIDNIRAFSDQHGLKLKYIAQQSGITTAVMYSWLAKRCILSNAQIDRLKSYMADYSQRNAS